MKMIDSPVNAVEKTDETDGIDGSRESLAKLLHVSESLVLLLFLFARRFRAHLPAGEGLPGEPEHFFVAGAEESDVVELSKSALIRWQWWLLWHGEIILPSERGNEQYKHHG